MIVKLWDGSVIRCIVFTLLFSCSSYQFDSGQEATNGGNNNSISSELTADQSPTTSEMIIEQFPARSGEGFEVFSVEITTKKLDILIVVDNSTTMNRANMALGEKITPLISEISTSNWQIVVTTSTITDCLRGIIKQGEGSLDAFKEIINKVHSKYLSVNDLDSSNNEQVVKMARRALEGMPIAQNVGNRTTDIDCRGERKRWLRPDSLLVVLMVSDEDADDESQPHGGLPIVDPDGDPSDYRCENSSCIDDFYSYLSTIRVPHVSAKIYGIFDKRKNDLAPSGYGYHRSNLYLQWRDNENRSLFDLHHDLYQADTYILNDFDVIFKEISKNISTSLQNTFVLKNTYDADTTRVILTKTDNSTVELSPSTYTINNKTLKINRDQLRETTKVKIQKDP